MFIKGNILDLSISSGLVRYLSITQQTDQAKSLKSKFVKDSPSIPKGPTSVLRRR
ncbi:7148_t:CDS:2 [Funneliformis caledonium]|uniref:7148_t:CDS:1 n=1 Tax=Funneliformis caledonium TaxID=1117310 RepID=A0A9N9DRB5_9GLOM|nr:7148_t:CDS:2 [Funneliformis caledonium]